MNGNKIAKKERNKMENQGHGKTIIILGKIYGP